MTTPSENFATALNGAALGLPFYARPPKAPDDDGVTGAIPHRAGFVENQEGFDKDPIKGGGNMLPHRLKITVMSNPEEFVQGETDAQAAYDFLDQSPFAPYFEIQCDGTQPEHRGANGDKQHRFVLYATAWEREI